MWVWRRMAKVSWTEKKTNEEVLRMTGQTRKLIETIIDRKKNWTAERRWFNVRSNGGSDDRSRGRKRIGMLDELIEESYEELMRKAQDRPFWRIWKPWTCQ